MGGMFTGKIGLGGGINNQVKSIQTRSGHRIVFTEDESIIITDKSGNEIHLDTKGSNINITAPETMTLNCKNMQINVAENISTTVGMSQTNSVGMNKTETISLSSTESVGAMYNLSVGGNFFINVIGEMFEKILGNKKTDIKKDRINKSSGEIVNQSKGLNQSHSQKNMENNSGEQSKNF